MRFEEVAEIPIVRIGRSQKNASEPVGINGLNSLIIGIFFPFCIHPDAHILNFDMEMAMSKNHLNYLRREHARLDTEIRRETGRPQPDDIYRGPA